MLRSRSPARRARRPEAGPLQESQPPDENSRMATDVQRVRVLIADDDREIRAALAGLIATEASLDLVAEAKDADEAVELARRLRPDVALVDVRMPGGGGPRATPAIRSRCPPAQGVGRA